MSESRKKISEVTVLNEVTGEILERRAVYSSKYSESFIMLRTTDGLDWLYGLSGNAAKLILLMHQWSEQYKGRISIAAWQRELVMSKLKITVRGLYGLLKELELNDCLLKLGTNDFIVNPAHVFKCSTGEVREKIREYEYIKSKIKKL